MPVCADRRRAIDLDDYATWKQYRRIYETAAVRPPLLRFLHAGFARTAPEWNASEKIGRPLFFSFVRRSSVRDEFCSPFLFFFYNEIWYIIKPGLFLTRPDILLEYLMKNSSDELAEGIKRRNLEHDVVIKNDLG